MKDLNINIPKTSLKIIAFVIFYIIIALIFVWYAVIPKSHEIQQLNSEILTQEDHLNLLLLAQEKISTIDSDINNFTTRIADLQKVLPPERNEFLYGEEVLVLAKTCKVTITGMQFPSNISTNTPTQNVDFNISFESSKLGNVTQFINALKNFPQITELNEISISKGQSLALGSTTQGTAYSVSLKGVIYLSQRK
jgi:hypothetical protein